MRRIIIALIIIKVLMSIGYHVYLHDHRAVIGIDGEGYFSNAVNIVKYGTHYPDFYSNLLAVLYWLTESALVTRLIFLGLSLLSTLLVFKIAKILFDERAALWAAAIFFLEPSQCIYAITYQKDTLLCFLVLMTVLSTILYHLKKNWGYLFIAGICVAFMAFLRSPNIHLLKYVDTAMRIYSSATLAVYNGYTFFTHKFYLTKIGIVIDYINIYWYAIFALALISIRKLRWNFPVIVVVGLLVDLTLWIALSTFNLEVLIRHKLMVMGLYCILAGGVFYEEAK